MDHSSVGKELVEQMAHTVGVSVDDLALEWGGADADGKRLAESTLTTLESDDGEEVLRFLVKLTITSMSHENADYALDGSQISVKSLEAGIAAKRAVLAIMNMQALLSSEVDTTGVDPDFWLVGDAKLDARINAIIKSKPNSTDIGSTGFTDIARSTKLSDASQTSFKHILQATYGDYDPSYFLSRSEGETSDEYKLSMRIKALLANFGLEHPKEDRSRQELATMADQETYSYQGGWKRAPRTEFGKLVEASTESEAIEEEVGEYYRQIAARDNYLVTDVIDQLITGGATAGSGGGDQPDPEIDSDDLAEDSE